jgi:hypothetical protein
MAAIVAARAVATSGCSRSSLRTAGTLRLNLCGQGQDCTSARSDCFSECVEATTAVGS